MYRVGIIGSENSHCMAFAKIFNGLENGISYPDIKVVAVGGHYPEESQKVFDACGLEFIAEKPEDMLGKVDAVMVTARNGKFHPEFARPFIEAGVPAFIDKPFANDGDEALALARLAKSKGVPLVGGSSTKYALETVELRDMVRSGKLGRICGGAVSAPVNMHNEYGGFYFYASHLAEISMTIFGYDVKSVAASLQGDDVSVIARYNDFMVSHHYHEANYNYTGLVYGTEGSYFKPININGSIGNPNSIYRFECDHFAHMLRTGEMDQTYEELVLPVYYLNAVEKAFTTGVEQEIPHIEV